MRLYVVRHGIAIHHSDPACPPEPERFLTPEGVKETRDVAQGLEVLGVKPGQMFTSPYVRAVQTAEIVAAALRFPTDKIQRTESLTPDGRPRAFLKELAGLKDDEVMCFGHAPQLDDLIAQAVGSRHRITALKNAGVACLEIEGLAPPRGLLLWLFPPKALRGLVE